MCFLLLHASAYCLGGGYRCFLSQSVNSKRSNQSLPKPQNITHWSWFKVHQMCSPPINAPQQVNFPSGYQIGGIIPDCMHRHNCCPENWLRFSQGRIVLQQLQVKCELLEVWGSDLSRKRRRLAFTDPHVCGWPQDSDCWPVQQGHHCRTSQGSLQSQVQLEPSPSVSAHLDAVTLHPLTLWDILGSPLVHGSTGSNGLL